MELTPAAPGSARRLYRPSSLPVNLQHDLLQAAALTPPECSASATDDEERGLPVTSLRRGSEIKLASSVLQAAISSSVSVLVSQLVPNAALNNF